MTRITNYLKALRFRFACWLLRQCNADYIPASASQFAWLSGECHAQHQFIDQSGMLASAPGRQAKRKLALGAARIATLLELVEVTR